MILLRRLARPMLASPFLVGGVDALRHPQTTSAVSARAARELTTRIPKAEALGPDAAVRVSGGLMTAAAAMLATGRMPRVASAVLIASVVPALAERAKELKTDEKSDPDQLAEKRMQFLGSLAVVGGLLVAAVDTAGRPSLGRRAKYAGAAAQRTTRHARSELKHSAREAALAAKAATARLT